MSESEEAGRLTSIPGIVEAAPTKPDQSVGVWRIVAKEFSRVLDMVELKIAKSPIIQSVQKTLLLVLFAKDTISKSTRNLHS
jgi:hypothetical protein